MGRGIGEKFRSTDVSGHQRTVYPQTLNQRVLGSSPRGLTKPPPFPTKPGSAWLFCCSVHPPLSTCVPLKTTRIAVISCSETTFSEGFTAANIPQRTDAACHRPAREVAVLAASHVATAGRPA